MIPVTEMSAQSLNNTEENTQYSHSLFTLLPSAKRSTSIRCCTTSLWNSFFPQALGRTKTTVQHERTTTCRMRNTVDNQSDQINVRCLTIQTDRALQKLISHHIKPAHIKYNSCDCPGMGGHVLARQLSLVLCKPTNKVFPT